MTSLQDAEKERQQEQARLDLFMAPGERNRRGQFATPQTLAREIVTAARQLWGKQPIRFLEPAVGTGSFYSALLSVFPLGSVESAAGFEIDPGHVEVARKVWRGKGLRVTLADFTVRPPPRRRFNFLITNPPYVRHHHLTPQDKKRLKALVQERLGIEVSGLAGLYCYFLLLSHSWVEENGLSAWLIPSEFMDVNYGAALKRYLTERVKLLHVHRFRPSDVQFNDALVSSSVVIFEKAPPPPGHVVVFSLGGSLLEPDGRISVPLSILLPGDKWSRHSRGGWVHQAEERFGPMLGDLFHIKRGLATGANGFFILLREKAIASGIPDAFLKPILPGPRRLPGDVIESSPDGYPHIVPQFGLIDCCLPDEELRKYYPSFWNYIRCGEARRIHRGYLASRRSPWYSQENRPPAPFLCTYMGRSANNGPPFRFIWNKSSATAHNVYLLLYPRPVLQQAMHAHPELQQEVFRALQRIDLKRAAEGGRVYGGGLHKMEPRELGAVSAKGVAEVLGNGFGESAAVER